MMPSLLHTNLVGVPHIPHASYATDSVLDELSRQLAATSNSRRHSRGSGNQRVGNMGNAMRITKPGSANNSPRSSGLHSRRKTLFTEGHQRPHLQPMEVNYMPTPTTELSRELGHEPERRPARPVSWHPGSQQQLQQASPLPYSQSATMGYPFPNYNDPELFASYQQFPPTPMAYSGYTSPTSAFSPLSLPYSGMGSQQYHSPTGRPLPSQQQQPQQQPQQLSSSQSCNPPRYSGASTAASSAEIPYLPAPKLMATGGPLDWETFRAQGFDKYAAPPTPEDFVAQPPLPVPATKQDVSGMATTTTRLASEDAIPFQPLDDDESEGEILYGMGLYDAPDHDPVMDFHRSTVLSLLGATGGYPEPTGKGLKLEDAWEPPASDDEDEEEDDSGEEKADQDADGEDV